MDDIYSIPGEYTLNRSAGLDFALLDLSMVNTTVLVVDQTPLDVAKARALVLFNKCNDLKNKINQQQINLSKVKGKPQVEAKIISGINSLNNDLSLLQSQYVVAEAAYNAINNDFTVNADYFKNKAILEGIRNSIAHGHYEIIPNNDFYDSIIRFNDIYEGNLTFQAEIKFIDFERMVGDNAPIIINFINNKIGMSKGSLSLKK